MWEQDGSLRNYLAQLSPNPGAETQAQRGEGIAEGHTAKLGLWKEEHNPFNNVRSFTLLSQP
jgi:hypothetical protein